MKVRPFRRYVIVTVTRKSLHSINLLCARAFRSMCILPLSSALCSCFVAGDGNDMLFCDHCNHCYHQSCHNLESLPDEEYGGGLRLLCSFGLREPWFCDTCLPDRIVGQTLWKRAGGRRCPSRKRFAEMVPESGKVAEEFMGSVDIKDEVKVRSLWSFGYWLSVSAAALLAEAAGEIAGWAPCFERGLTWKELNVPILLAELIYIHSQTNRRSGWQR